MSTNFQRWRDERHKTLRGNSFPCPSVSNLTILAYFFWDDERIESEFWTIEFAFLQTFSQLGLLPSVLVTNRETDSMRQFATAYGVTIEVEPTLTKGLPSMSHDCIFKLHTRFQTDYVLIIQNDGMPLRGGIDDFLGKFDYIGAPWPGHCTWKDLFPYPKFGVGNGGFSLRSKALCQQVAVYAQKYFRILPASWFVMTEDVFFCKTLPLLLPSIRKRFRYASIDEALAFSHECDVPGYPLTTLPFGFHSSKGFPGNLLNQI